MMFRAAIALLVLAMPVFAQRGGGHAGSAGSRASVGHAGFSASSGSRSTGFATSAPQFRLGTPGVPGYRQLGPPRYANFASPYNAYRSPAGRSPYSRTPYSGASNDRTRARSAFSDNRASDHDRDRWGARRRSFQNWYVNTYPAFLGYGYPYLLDPGFYDWDDSADSTNTQGTAAQDYPPYQDYGYGAPGETPQHGYPEEFPPESAQLQQRAAAKPITPSAPAQPLMVIFLDGRSPVKMQNYMMTSMFLTDLDSQHYEQIPIDQIDVAATQRANSSAGIGFQIPASRD